MAERTQKPARLRRSVFRPSLHPDLDQLEDRVLLAASLTITNAFLANSSGQSINSLATGEEVFLAATWTTSGLQATDSYVIGFTVDGVTLDSRTLVGESGDGLTYLWYIGGWFASAGNHTATVIVDPAHSVAGADESQTSSTFTFTATAPTTLPGKFLNPVGTVRSNWTIVNYVDVNPFSPDINDYNGGAYTYDGHTGIDMTVANFATMDAGFPVHAALGGTVTDVVDGNFDRDTAFTTNPANYVVIDNGNNWQTIYYHFMNHSISVKVGQTVTAGQVIGLIGSSGSSTDPHLHFEVHHNGDVVETNYDPSDYWIAPFQYQASLAPYVMASGTTTENPPPDLKEGPPSVTTFSTSSGLPVVYWYKVSHLNPNDTSTITWYRPDGTLVTTNGFTATDAVRDGGYYWVLPAATLGTFTGTWHVALSVNNVEISRSSFTVVSGAGVPAARVTQGNTSGPYIIDNRTTPIDFGSVAQGAFSPQQSFTVQNIGSSTLTTSGLVLPPNFSLVGSFPSSIAPGTTASFTIALATGTAGTQFGALSFATNVPGQGLFTFNLAGTVTGSAPAPAITLMDPAAVFDPRVGPVVIDKDATFTDSASGGPIPASLTVQLASGGTAFDHLGIVNQGNGAGTIGISGNTVLYGGSAIGTFTGGDNLQPLTVAFNATASIAAAQALLGAITFRTDLPMTFEPRYVRFSLTDSKGLTSNLAVKTVEVNPGLAGLSFSSTNLTVASGGTTTYSVSLLSQPSAPVTVALTPGSSISVTPTMLVFTPANWTTPQTVTIDAATISGGPVTTAVTSTVTSTDPNYQGLASASVGVTVTPGLNTQLALAPSPADPTYGQSETLTATVSTVPSGGGTPGGTVTFMDGASSLGTVVLLGGVAQFTTSSLSAGSHALSAVYSGDSNDNGNSASLELTVAKAHLTVTADPKSRPYGAATPPLTATLSGFVNGDSSSVVSGAAALTTATASSNVGSYPITVGLGTLSATNYDFTNLVNGTLTVTQAHLTVTADSKSKPYRAANPPLTATLSGFVNGDSVASLTTPVRLSTTATAKSPPGSYPITASGASDPNYTITYVPGMLTVRAVVPGDYNGDGKADPALYSAATRTWTIAGVYPNGLPFGQVNVDIPVPGNYDGTGMTEIANFRSTTGQWFIRGHAQPISVGRKGDLPVPGDYYGSGRDVEAVFRPSTGQWIIAGAAKPIVVVAPRTGDIPVPGDYNGDGRVDEAIYRPSTSQWFIDVAGKVQTVKFGGANAIPVPGDYYGTGKATEAVFFPKTGQWMIAGTAKPIVVVAPRTGDIAVPGNYDGTGKVEEAIYRPSTATWSIDNAGKVRTVRLGSPNQSPASEPYAYRLSKGQVTLRSVGTSSPAHSIRPSAPG